MSKYAEHFVLKGGIFLYAVFDRRYERATTDVDLLARRISNSGEEMKNVFREILSLDIDDALVFDIDSITVEDITEFKEYHTPFYAHYNAKFLGSKDEILFVFTHDKLFIQIKMTQQKTRLSFKDT